MASSSNLWGIDIVSRLRASMERESRFRAKMDAKKMYYLQLRKMFHNRKLPKTNPEYLRDIHVSVSEGGLQAMHEVLDIDLILELIFSHCSVNSLKACRQVSRRWRDLSLKAWRKAAVLFITENEDEHFLQISKVNAILGNVEAGDSKADEYQLLDKPFQALGFQYWHTAVFVQTGLRSPVQHSVAKRFKDHTRYLDLSMQEFYISVLELIMRDFTKLTRLILIASKIRKSYGSRSLENIVVHEHLQVLEMHRLRVQENFPWAHFLGHFSHLWKLTLGFDNDKNEEGEAKSKEELKKALVGMQALREKSEENLNLKELNILEYHPCPLSSFAEGLPNAMRGSKFALERFSVDLGATTHPLHIASLLGQYSETLEWLQVTRGLDEKTYGGMSERKVLELKRMASAPIRLEKLEELRCLNGPHWAFHLLSILDAPKLRKVVFESVSWLRQEEDENVARRLEKDFQDAQVLHLLLKGKVFLELERFEYEHGWNLLGSKDLHALAEAMPNLEYLAIPLSAATFKDVCKLWPRLKSLEVRKCEGEFPEIDDEAMTGFTGAEMITALQPNITDLKELKDLIISCEKGLKTKDVKLTGHSVTHGFLKLPRLHYLSVAFQEISEEEMSALVEHAHYVDVQKLRQDSSGEAVPVPTTATGE